MGFEVTQAKLLGGVGVAAALLGALALWPAVSEIRRVGQEISAAQQRLDGTQFVTQELPALIQEVQTIRSRIASTHKTIPHTGEIDGLLREVTMKLESQKLSNPVISTLAVTSGPSYSTQPIQIAFSGSPLGVLGFVREVESMPRLIEVKRMNLHVDRKAPERVQAEVELHAFFHHGPQDGAK